MSTAPRLDLSRPRNLGELLGDSLRLYLGSFGTFLLIAAAVVIPVQVIVSGIGLEQITAPYDPDPEPAEQLVPVAVGYLVTAPLLVAMTIHALLQAAAGQAPSAGRSIASGLEAFAPIFLAILLAAAGVGVGLLLFIAPGIYLAIRWLFVAQAVVVDGRRGWDALVRSGELVRRSWWRVFGIELVVALIAAVPVTLLELPLAIAAEQADSAALLLVGSILGQIAAGPFVALVNTLLFFDLSARKAGRIPAPVAPGRSPPRRDGPPDPPGLPPREPGDR